MLGDKYAIKGKYTIHWIFDIGGTKCAVCIASFDGTGLKILDKLQISTDHIVSGYEMIDRMYLLAKNGLNQ